MSTEPVARKISGTAISNASTAANKPASMGRG
jgi:hypothetical protein